MTSLAVKTGIADLAAEHDHYLYGTPLLPGPSSLVSRLIRAIPIKRTKRVKPLFCKFLQPMSSHNGGMLQFGIDRLKTELNISSFGVDQDNELYIIDLNGAIYRFGAEPPNDIDAPAGNPSTFSLDQNYPNPFNPTTAIRYTVASTVPVKLEVFNLRGQRVALLAEGVRAAGTYMVTWEASGWASGVYFYRLEAGQRVFTKKLML